MLEFKRLLKTTSIRWCLVIITLLGMILYLFNQLNGLTIQEFLARNNTYHSLIYAQQKSPQTVEEISRDLKDITIRNVLSDPNNFLYTSYLEEYPEYVSSADAEQENLHDLEWAYTALLHQVNFHSQLLSRPEKMRMEYEQKISNPLFRNQQNTLDTMQQTIIDFGKIADVRPSVGDDRLITSVTENHYNLLLQLVLIVCVATVLRLEKQSPLWYTLSATKRGRRWLAWSKICCLLYFTILSQLLLLVPQFIISSILYDGSNQCMRLIQSVETFSKVLIPCTIPFFTAIYIISSMILFSFVTMLAWTLMSCLHHRNFVLVVFAALLGISYISYLLPASTRFTWFKYINLVACLQPADALAAYCQIHILNWTVNAPILLVISALCSNCVLATINLISANKTGDKYAPIKYTSLSRIPISRQLPQFIMETGKVLLGGKSLIALVIASTVLFLYQPPVYRLEGNDMYKQAYYSMLQGADPEVAQQTLANEKISIIDRLNVAQQMLQGDNSDPFILSDLIMQYQERLAAVTSITEETEKLIIYNQTHRYQTILCDYFQADAILGVNGQSHRLLWALLLLALILFPASVAIPFERQSGMLPIIHATRKGISSLVRNKVSSVYLIVALIVLCVWLPEGCILAQQLPFTIAAQSLPSLLNVPYDISLCEFWLAMMSYRLMLALDIVSLAMMISVFLHSAYQSLFIIEAAILLPNAVAIVFPVLRIPLLFVSAISSHEWYLAFMPVLATTITLVCLANMVIPIALKRKL